jgi:hypothetical protein
MSFFKVGFHMLRLRNGSFWNTRLINQVINWIIGTIRFLIILLLLFREILRLVIKCLAVAIKVDYNRLINNNILLYRPVTWRFWSVNLHFVIDTPKFIFILQVISLILTVLIRNLLVLSLMLVKVLNHLFLLLVGIFSRLEKVSIRNVLCLRWCLNSLIVLNIKNWFILECIVNGLRGFGLGGHMLFDLLSL